MTTAIKQSSIDNLVNKAFTIIVTIENILKPFTEQAKADNKDYMNIDEETMIKIRNEIKQFLVILEIIEQIEIMSQHGSKEEIDIAKEGIAKMQTLTEFLIECNLLKTNNY